MDKFKDFTDDQRRQYAGYVYDLIKSSIDHPMPIRRSPQQLIPLDHSGFQLLKLWDRHPDFCNENDLGLSRVKTMGGVVTISLQDQVIIKSKPNQGAYGTFSDNRNVWDFIAHIINRWNGEIQERRVKYVEDERARYNAQAKKSDARIQEITAAMDAMTLDTDGDPTK